MSRAYVLTAIKENRNSGKSDQTIKESLRRLFSILMIDDAVIDECFAIIDTPLYKELEE